MFTGAIILATPGKAGFHRFQSASAQSIIGQFGVGFYSVFMVADQVDVFTRRWDAETGIHWSSDGQGGYTVKPVDGLSVGTQIGKFLIFSEVSLS